MSRMLRARWLMAKAARAFAVAPCLCLCTLGAHGDARPPPQTFIIHGTPKTCSAISEMDSALSSGYVGFFTGWTERDYVDAVAWAEACSTYGWHVPGRNRLALLRSQQDGALGPLPTRPGASAITTAARASAPLSSGSLVTSRLIWSAIHEVPADGSGIIGYNATVTAHYKDTLPDIARRYGLGYEEIRSANPRVDIWLPGEGTRIFLPGRHRLPSGPHEGVVVNLAEHRMYFFPQPSDSQKPTVITYPVSIGKLGDRSPLGDTIIIAKVEHPTWVPPASVRKEHAQRGEPLPSAVAPGPNNPLGEFMMRLGFGNGTYEIHGTNKPVSVGMDSTDGCIGMYPEDVAALFSQVQVGTPVRLVEERL